MNVYDRVLESYIAAKQNHFWDAWGVVASPITFDALKAECIECITLHTTKNDSLEKIFGLVVIPCEMAETGKIYIVDEKFGRYLIRCMADRGQK